jgi:hypothetical protein
MQCVCQVLMQEACAASVCGVPGSRSGSLTRRCGDTRKSDGALLMRAGRLGIPSLALSFSATMCTRCTDVQLRPWVAWGYLACTYHAKSAGNGCHSTRPRRDGDRRSFPRVRARGPKPFGVCRVTPVLYATGVPFSPDSVTLWFLMGCCRREGCHKPEIAICFTAALSTLLIAAGDDAKWKRSRQV